MPDIFLARFRDFAASQQSACPLSESDYCELLPIITISMESRDSSVGTALTYGLDDRGFESHQRLRIFLFTTASIPAVGPPSLLSNG
jgi:hypothetical protein